MILIHYLKHLRDLYYQHIVWRKYKIGKGFHCGRGVFIWGRNKIEIGKNFYIGKYSIIETFIFKIYSLTLGSFISI